MLIRIADAGAFLYGTVSVLLLGGAGVFMYWAATRWKEARRSHIAVVYWAAAGNGLMALGACWVWWRLVTGEPPLSASVGLEAVELRYRWRTERIAYSDMRDVQHEIRRGRRGRDEVHLRIVTGERVHGFVVIPAQDPGAREAVARLAGELRDRFRSAGQ